MKTKFISSAILILGVSIAVSAQTAEWTKGFAFAALENMASDNQGNSYVASYYYSDPLEIDGTVITPENDGSSYLAKFSKEGNLEWLINMVASSSITATDVNTTASGNIVVCGYSLGLVDFGGMTFGNESDAFFRGFIAVYNADGIIQKVGGTNGDATVAFLEVVIDDAENYFVAGLSEGEFSFGADDVPFYGNQDAVYGKFDSDLDQKWMRSVGDIGEDAGISIDLDNSGNILIAGYHEGTFLFDATYYFLSYGGTDLFLLKAQNDGDILWVRTLGSVEDEAQLWMSVMSDDDGNVYLGSNMGEEINHGGGLANSYGGSDFFYTAYDADGFFQWFTHGGGVDYDIALGFAKGNDDNIYAYGYFIGTAEVDGLILNADGYDGFIAEFGLDGNSQWVTQTSGLGDEYITALCVDPWQNIIMGGYTGDEMSIGGMDIDLIEDYDVTDWMAKITTPDSQPETAITSQVINSTMQLYPNPASTELHVNVETGFGQIDYFEIIDMQGVRVKSIDYLTSGNTIQVADLHAGCYTLIPVYNDNRKGNAVSFVVVH